MEEHNMTVVSADGAEVVPQSIDRLIIFPGERYDILVEGLASPTKKSYRFVGDGEALKRRDDSNLTTYKALWD